MRYDRWAAKHNLKQMAATVTAYRAVRLSSPEELDEACSAAYTAMRESLTELKQMEKTLNGKEDKAATAGACLFLEDPPCPGRAETAEKRQKKRKASRQKYESDFIIAPPAARYFERKRHFQAAEL